MNIYLLFLPIFLVYTAYYITQLYCSSFQKSKKNRSSLPSYIFQIIWPILLLLIGLAWSLSCLPKKFISSHSILILSLTIYIPLSLCFCFDDLILLLLLFTLTLRIILLEKNKIAFMSLLPLLFWLITVIYFTFL